MALPEYPVTFWVCAVAAVLLMGVTKASFGGGIGILATPLLALTVSVADAVALLFPLLLTCDFFAVRHYRRTFDKGNVTRLLPGSVIGVIAGAFFFGYFSQHERVLEIGLGFLALFFVSFQLARRAILGALQKGGAGTVQGVLMGAASGFTSTIAHAGGPPVVVYLLPQQLPRQIFVGTTVIFFAFLNLLKLLPYCILGLFHVEILKTTLVLSPLAYVGVKVGVFLNEHFTDVWFNRVAYGILTLTAAQLILGKNLLDLVL